MEVATVAVMIVIVVKERAYSDKGGNIRSGGGKTRQRNFVWCGNGY